VTSGEFEILAGLERWGPLTAGELLSDWQRIWGGGRTWQGYAAKLRALERRGFVYRSDPVAHIWDLTEKAREVLAA
jgi:DNA-binding HxlR family transcriptional regulator